MSKLISKKQYHKALAVVSAYEKQQQSKLEAKYEKMVGKPVRIRSTMFLKKCYPHLVGKRGRISEWKLVGIRKTDPRFYVKGYGVNAFFTKDEITLIKKKK